MISVSDVQVSTGGRRSSASSSRPRTAAVPRRLDEVPSLVPDSAVPHTVHIATTSMSPVQTSCSSNLLKTSGTYKEVPTGLSGENSPTFPPNFSSQGGKISHIFFSLLRDMDPTVVPLHPLK